MAKRMISSDLFHEDWFLELKGDTKLFWIYALTNCDHGGFLKANFKAYNALNDTDLDADEVFAEINAEKPRIREITKRLWLIEDFIPFQYGPKLNPNNRVHASIINLFEKNCVSLNSIKGLNSSMIELNDGIKDKEIEKEKEKEKDKFEKGLPQKISEVEEAFRSAMNAMALPLDALGGFEKMAADFFHHFEAQGWRRGNGMLIMKWRALIPTWIQREKSRIQSNIETSKSEYSWNL